MNKTKKVWCNHCKSRQPAKHQTVKVTKTDKKERIPLSRQICLNCKNFI